MKKLAAWLTLQRRQDIQVLSGTLVTLLIFTGMVTESDAEQWQTIATAVLQAVAAVINLVNLRGAWDVWTVLRGAIYTLAATVAPALTALRLTTEEQQSLILTGLSLTLTVLSSLLAVLVSGRQETEEAVTVAIDVSGMTRREYRARLAQKQN